MALARLVSLLESRSPPREASAVALAALRCSGRSHVIGVTGSPGSGKSTLISSLIRSWREADETVGVVLVDPTSPLSGGAVLGDRVRMVEHARDRGVFIRSMASRAAAGGLAEAVPSVIRLLDACGYGRIVVEAVGAGQLEVDVSKVVDTTVVVLSPGAGDSVQLAKAGLLEVADLYVVNKADLGAPARSLLVEVEAMAQLTVGPEPAWTPKVLGVSATEGNGVAEVARAVADHRNHLLSVNKLQSRRRAGLRHEVHAAALALMRSRLDDPGPVDLLEEQVRAVERGELEPLEAARSVVETLAGGSF